MSSKHKVAPRTYLPKRSPETTPGVFPTTQSPEMAASGREIEISGLTFRGRSALPAVAVS